MQANPGKELRIKYKDITEKKNPAEVTDVRLVCFVLCRSRPLLQAVDSFRDSHRLCVIV